MTKHLAKILPIAAALTLASPAAATCTWTTVGPYTGKVVCTTVGETALAFAAGKTVGWDASLCRKGFVVLACNDGANALTAAATLSLYVYDGIVAGWVMYPDQNITTATITAAQQCQAFDGKWMVVDTERIALLPTAGTLAGGNFTIHFRCN
jgi:hypothetical protein